MLLAMRAGYTLIELLAVAVVLGLSAGLGVPALIRSAAGDPLAIAATQLEREERHVRLVAQGSGTTLELRADGWTAGPTTVRLDRAVDVAWRGAAGPISRVAVDDRGRSVDYEAVIRCGDRQRRFAVAGLTGEWRAIDVAEPR